MRKIAATMMIALSLAAAPVMAAPPGGFISSIPRDFLTGADYYFKTVSGWIMDFLDMIGLYEKLRIANEGGDCSGDVRCAPGLICLNAPGSDGRAYGKLCFKGPASAAVVDEYLPCGGGDLCAKGLWCTDTCLAGADCGDGNRRCLRPTVPIGSCDADADCRAVCGRQPFPPFGSSAFAAICVKNGCVCDPVGISPSDARVDCQGGETAVLACPPGTIQACATAACPSGRCLPHAACLTSPASGGTCLNDAECSNASCPEGAAPFCEPDERLCKCKASVAATISCVSASDCTDKAACGPKQVASCVQGACACAAAGAVTSCAKASDCSSDCPAGFAPACVAGSCACQRTIADVPVACAGPSDCGGVSCPAGYDKACIDSKCSCARAVQR